MKLARFTVDGMTRLGAVLCDRPLDNPVVAQPQ